ncbi:ATP-binding protein [Halomicrobium salinisoli]|uniref:ATP-binding protein n=1 Tax=Halomicrobium salinisoli TaxID=2878391 RepID=UPI001CF07785|nr:DUF87 domain-containing protein [Halomicrobium salinisoli]
MAETEEITVATTSAGPGGSEEPGRPVDLPVVELLTGRGFATGKSGSGKSNTASVIAEKLLDNGFGVLVVDIDGEYYGLKEEYEILHVGADEECDIQVTVEHAEKIASLALEENVPIILDVSSFLDMDEAEELLTEVARHLFAKAKKEKQPYLLLVEECHEWMPEKGSMGEVGQMLIKIGKRGRKHGLGMVGISQRPADVKKDYITQCDWLVWHRLTWNNDTKVVGRIIDNEYADAVEDLNDGEAFLMTDWSEQIRRVQFHRKQTFDAGATPGLEDFERPELKSVSEDLVSELTEISEAEEEREDRIKELREILDEKNSRIAELEKELQDARDLSRMAEQFTEALLDHVEGYNPGRTEQERMHQRRLSEIEPDDGAAGAASGGSPQNGADAARSNGAASPADSAPDATAQTAPVDGPAAGNAAAAENGAQAGTAATAANTEGEAAEAPADAAPDSTDEGAASGGANAVDEDAEIVEAGDQGADAPAGADGEPVDDESAAEATAADDPAGAEATAAETDDADADLADRTSGGGLGDAFGSFAEDGPALAGGADGAASGDGGAAAESGGEPTVAALVGGDAGDQDAADSSESEGLAAGGFDASDHVDDEDGAVERHVIDLITEVKELDVTARRMLAYYVEQGPDTPLNAHFSAGGSGDRTGAYANNRELRLSGFVEHVGRGQYDARLTDLVREGVDRTLEPERVERMAGRLERAITGE